jgi:DNA polymerase
MDTRELRRWLEFYRDLGVETLYVAQPLAAEAGGKSSVQGDAGGAGALQVDAGIGPKTQLAAAAGPGSPLAGMRERVLQAAAGVQRGGLVPLFDAGPEGDTLERIAADIGDCRRCKLCEGRSKIVFGSGNPEAKLVFVGEGPGEEEDLQGLPFVGRAGQLLTQMINNTAAKEGMQVRREDVYICNVVKCRPPKNRTPEPDEMEICGQFLYRQLNVIRPRAICALGATAAKALLNVKEGITKLRGRWHKWRDIPVMPTYHPSYLLRPYNQNAKREAWEDLKKVLHYVYDEPPRAFPDI